MTEFGQEIGRHRSMGNPGNQLGIDPTSDLYGVQSNRLGKSIRTSAIVLGLIGVTACGGGGGTTDKDKNSALINSRNYQLSQPTPQPGPGIGPAMETAQAVRTQKAADALGVTTPTPLEDNSIPASEGGWITTPQ